MKDGVRFAAAKTRQYLQQRGFLPANIIRHCYRPFDDRWLYWEPETKLLDEKRAEYFPHAFSGNIAMVATAQNRRDFNPPIASTLLCARHVIERGANVFPLYLRSVARTLFDTDGAGEPVPNLSERARQYLAAMDAPPDALFFHTLAVLHTPAYREENAGALRQDWPRVPLPTTGDALRASAALGRQVAALLDAERGVPGVTDAPMRPDLAPVGPVRRVGGGGLNPTAGDLAMRAGWGHGGNGAPVMPARGKTIEREYTPEERAALVENSADALALLGVTCHDVYLNEWAYWVCVPANVWRYTLGGYQVLKKWLSYRERRVLGRNLRPKEVREATAIARRITALLLLSPALNANYGAATESTYGTG